MYFDIFPNIHGDLVEKIKSLSSLKHAPSLENNVVGYYPAEHKWLSTIDVFGPTGFYTFFEFGTFRRLTAI